MEMEMDMDMSWASDEARQDCLASRQADPPAVLLCLGAWEMLVAMPTCHWHSTLSET